jgi:hypothetical protein
VPGEDNRISITDWIQYLQRSVRACADNDIPSFNFADR